MKRVKLTEKFCETVAGQWTLEWYFCFKDICHLTEKDETCVSLLLLRCRLDSRVSIWNVPNSRNTRFTHKKLLRVRQTPRVPLERGPGHQKQTLYLAPNRHN